MDVILLVDMPIYERFPSKFFMKERNVFFFDFPGGFSKKYKGRPTWDTKVAAMSGGTFGSQKSKIKDFLEMSQNFTKCKEMVI